MTVPSNNRTPSINSDAVDTIVAHQRKFTDGTRTSSVQTNYQLSPLEDKISCIANGLEVLVYDVAKTTLEARAKFTPTILSHVAFYKPHKVTIFSGDERGVFWMWNSKARYVTCMGSTLINHPILGLWYDERSDLLVAFDKYVFTLFRVMKRSIFASLQVLQDNPTGAYVNFAGLGSRMITYCYEARETRLQKLVLWSLNPVGKIAEKRISLVDTPQIHESWLIARTIDGDIEIWDTKEGTTVKITAPFTDGLCDIHPVGQFIFATGEDQQGLIKAFDLTSGVCKSTTPLEGDCIALKTGIDPTGRFLIVVKDLEAYPDEGEGFLQVFSIEKSDVTFVTSVSSKKCCPIKSGPILAFSPDGNQVCVSCVVATEKRIEDGDAASVNWMEGVSFVLLYDLAQQKQVCFAPYRLGKHQRLLKTGASENEKIFIENLPSPHLIRFNSTLGGEAHYLYFNPTAKL